jgi:eukaryotic-like serine/threonine-protein kinase
MSRAPAAALFPARFSLERPLGAGAFGSVFVVWDREREQRVALKRLERADPASIYRFKQEFRALADLVHPNLVRLHELFALDDGWCFTMDLVEGVRFDNWARGIDVPAGFDSAVETISPSAAGRGASETVVEIPSSRGGPDERPLPPRLPFDDERLRAATRELFRGVLALHDAGILHRDLKPSNVLVEQSGRVAILDFGLAATGVVDSHKSLDGAVAGTPAYMAPEQAKGLALTTATDFYAVGAMIYEVLCGHVPFQSGVAEMLAARAHRDLPDPRSSWQGLPDDLTDLSMALLRREPARRPTAVEVSHRLELEPRSVGHSWPVVAANFVGREAELAQLRSAYELAASGKTVVAHVHGASGNGKTTLVRRFLTDVAARGEVVVLEGRCYERESVPFKAFDELVDALGRYLMQRRPVEAAGLVPRDAPALLRLFPSLGRLELMATVPGRPATADAHELRRRAFGALREMFTRITDSRPVVLFIDDVQWGDADSAQLARDLLAPPDTPPLLLVVGYRGDAEYDNELLRVLRTPVASDAGWEKVDVSVGALPEADARALAIRLLGDAENADGQSRVIAAEAAGSPLFVSELARTARAGRAQGQAVSLQRVVGERVASLGSAARTLLELLSCSERPLEERELRAASAIDAQELSMAVDRLRDEHLIAVTQHRSKSLFAVPHDKLRLSVREGIDSGTVRSHHLALARALETAEDVEPETLAHHFRSGGADKESLLWSERAGDRADEGAAFDRAATLYGYALEHASGVDRRRLMRKLATALANAGRGLASAEAYLKTAAELDGEAALEARQRAAEQYLRAGHVAEALQTFGPVLKEADLDLPRTPKTALMSLLYQRAKFKLRGRGFRERAESDIAPDELHRIDLCWTLGNGLSGIDLVRSARYHASSLLLSLDSGEPYRVTRALAMHAVMKSLESAEGARHAQAIALEARALGEKSGDPGAVGWAAASQAIAAWGNSSLESCVAFCDEAMSLLRERSAQHYREIGSLQVWFALHSLFLLGDLKRFEERAPACAREAEARGDRYTLSTVRAYDMPILWAIRDRPEEGRREADAAIEPWPAGSWYHQHWARLRAHCLLDLYSGEGARVVERTREGRPLMQRSMQLRIRTLRLELNYLEGRGALAEALSGTSPRLLALVREKAEALDAEKSGLATAYAEVLRAGAAALGDGNGAVAAFAKAREALAAMPMPLHVAAVDYRLAVLAGDEAAREAAAGRLAALGVASPPRFVDMLVPGLHKK